MRWRDLGGRDARALADLDALCFPAHTAFSAEEFSRLLVGRHTQGRGAELDRRLVGCVLISLHGDIGEVVTIDVHPDYRGQGMGRGMLRWAHGAMRERSTALATLHVRWNNTAALSLYRSEGYVVLQRLREYYPDGEDGLRMAKVLKA